MSRMARVRKAPTGSRVQIHGKGWRKAPSIAADKYTTISRAILASLTKTPMTFTDLVKRVKTRVGAFEGSIPWYTISCLRELGVQGRVVRQRKPPRYSRR